MVIFCIKKVIHNRMIIAVYFHQFFFLCLMAPLLYQFLELKFCRWLVGSPTKQFSRKDGSPFLLRTMTVYDNDSTASVKLWAEKDNLNPGQSPWVKK